MISTYKKCFAPVIFGEQHKGISFYNYRKQVIPAKSQFTAKLFPFFLQFQVLCSYSDGISLTPRIHKGFEETGIKSIFKSLSFANL